MSSIKKVALAGAGGLMGSAILTALLQSDFDVTVLTRQDSTSTFPPSVTVVRVDYASKPSLVSALRGQHAVVSALTHLALETSERHLIDAAAEAGVARFVPSEFGSDDTNPKAAAFPLYAAKVAAHRHLEEAAAASPQFTWTSIVTGPLLGWVATQAFVQPKEKKAQLYDGGSRAFSVVTRDTIGRAVVAVLSHPGETANRVVKVHAAVVTLERVLGLVQKAVGGGDEAWTVTTPSVEETLANAWAGVKAGKFDFATILGFIAAASQGSGYGGLLEGTDNDMLGIPVMTDEEVQAYVEKVVADDKPTAW